MQNAPSSRKRSAGFTLIELMITVAIVAILATIAYPSYTDYLRRGQVQEAPTTLADYRAQMEQYYQDNRNYGTGGCGVTAPNPAGAKFTYACSLANSGQGYSATASPVAGNGLITGLQYSINQLNNQGTTCTGCAWNFSTQTSWVLRKP